MNTWDAILTEKLEMLDSKTGVSAINARTVDTHRIGEQLSSIDELRSIIERLNTMQADALAQLARAETLHMADIDTLGAMLVKVDTIKYKKSMRGASLRPEVDVKQDKSDKCCVHLTKSIFMEAISVPSFEHVRQDGYLYYVRCANHFAIKLAGVLLHGNIGTITSDACVDKIKECKHPGKCDKKTCRYYHDPLIVSGSRDIRNYIRGRANTRRFNCLRMLDLDTTNASVEEFTIFRDRMFHDLLCVMAYYSYDRAQKD